MEMWRSELLGSGVVVPVTAKAYQLPRAVLTTAVDAYLMGSSALPAPIPPTARPLT